MRQRFSTAATGAFLLASGGVGLALVGFACSLGLDESLIAKKDAAAIVTIDANLPDGTTISDSGVPQVPNGQSCKLDTDCVAANACLKGKCDLARGSCAYDVCRPAACSVGVCDQAAKTCGTPATYHEEAAQFTLAAPINCGGCVAAAYPYLFVGTRLGLLAYNVGNIALVNPATVPIAGVGFIPVAMARSGNRIWLAGSPSGSGNTSTVPIAYLDVPADPFAAKIEATTVLLGYNRPVEGFGLLARDSQTVLLFSGAATFPSSVLTAPLADPTTAVATALQPTMGSTPITVSGTRLLMSSITAGVPQFNFITGAGTPTPTTSASVTIAEEGANYSVSRGFGTAVDGTVFWTTGVNDLTQPPVGNPTTTEVRGYLLVNDASSSISGTITGVQIEAYDNANPLTALGANAAVAGPVAMLDNANAMVTTAAKEAPTTSTAVQFLKREPLGVVGGRRVVIPAAIGTIAGVSGSDGLGYVVTNDPAAAPDDPPTGHVYVFDSACAPATP